MIPSQKLLTDASHCGQWRVFRVALARFIGHPAFDLVFNGVIVANSVFIGVEQSYRLQGLDLGLFAAL